MKAEQQDEHPRVEEGNLTEDIHYNYGAEFSEEDMDAIVHVEFLLTEYAWSDDAMTPAAERLKRDMQYLWARWSKKASTDQSEGQPPSET